MRPESERPEVNERCVGTTVVDGEIAEIWRRKESHSLGRDNGRNEHLWLKLTYDGTIEWVPWIDIATKRPCFEVKVVEGNRTKHKWGEVRITGSCSVEIFCNKRKVYEYRCRDMGYALARAQVLISKMTEHPVDFSDPEKLIGRKIWYENQAAVIDSLLLSQGCIMIRKEDGTNFNLSKPWNEEDGDDPWDHQNIVKDDIFSKSIWWFRD